MGLRGLSPSYFSLVGIIFFLLPCKAENKKNKRAIWRVAALYNLLPGGLCSDSFIFCVSLKLGALFHVIPDASHSLFMHHPSSHSPTHLLTTLLFYPLLFFFFFSSWMYECMSDNSSSSIWVTAKGFRVPELQPTVAEVEERCPSVWWDSYCLSIC